MGQNGTKISNDVNGDNLSKGDLRTHLEKRAPQWVWRNTIRISKRRSCLHMLVRRVCACTFRCQLPGSHDRDLGSIRWGFPQSGWWVPHSSHWCRVQAGPDLRWCCRKYSPGIEVSRKPGCSCSCYSDCVESSGDEWNKTLRTSDCFRAWSSPFMSLEIVPSSFVTNRIWLVSVICHHFSSCSRVRLRWLQSLDLQCLSICSTSVGVSIIFVLISWYKSQLCCLRSMFNAIHTMSTNSESIARVLLFNYNLQGKNTNVKSAVCLLINILHLHHHPQICTASICSRLCGYHIYNNNNKKLLQRSHFIDALWATTRRAPSHVLLFHWKMVLLTCLSPIKISSTE